jgi:hypothetical protein
MYQRFNGKDDNNRRLQISFSALGKFGSDSPVACGVRWGPWSPIQHSRVHFIAFPLLTGNRKLIRIRENLFGFAYATFG